MSVLKKISKSDQNEFIASLAKMMEEEGVSFEEVEDLNDFMYLACYYYVIGDLETTLQLTDFAFKVEFSKNMRIWAYVEQGLVLRSMVYKEKSEDDIAQQCIYKILNVLEKRTSLNQKVFKRNLNGTLLEYEKIESAENVKLEYDLRIAHLKELILIHEMGGGEEFSIDRAKKEIQENVVRLKVLIEKHNQPSRN